MKEKWIIGIGGSDMDSVNVEMVEGTEEQVKNYLFNLIIEDRKIETEGCEEYFDFGTESVQELTIRQNGNIYGFNCYQDKHIDYEAEKYTHCLEL